jgi:hypothetical protein
LVPCGITPASVPKAIGSRRRKAGVDDEIGPEPDAGGDSAFAQGMDRDAMFEAVRFVDGGAKLVIGDLVDLGRRDRLRQPSGHAHLKRDRICRGSQRRQDVATGAPAILRRSGRYLAGCASWTTLPSTIVMYALMVMI